jgi:hypothetical protein
MSLAEMADITRRAIEINWQRIRLTWRRALKVV